MAKSAYFHKDYYEINAIFRLPVGMQKLYEVAKQKTSIKATRKELCGSLYIPHKRLMRTNVKYNEYTVKIRPSALNLTIFKKNL